MNWKIVSFILLSQFQNILGKPFTSCRQEFPLVPEGQSRNFNTEFSDVESISEFPSTPEVLDDNEDGEPFGVKDITRVSDRSNLTPCERTVIIKCGEQYPEPEFDPTNADEDDDLLTSILDADVSHNLQNDHAHQNIAKDFSQQNKRAASGNYKRKERRNLMFEGLLKFTTLLNRIDDFFIGKARNFIKGINKMFESREESHDNYFD